MYTFSVCRCMWDEACVKNTEQEIRLMPQLAAYNVASEAIDFIRMGCTTITSSWP